MVGMVAVCLVLAGPAAFGLLAQHPRQQTGLDGGLFSAEPRSVHGASMCVDRFV